MLKTSTIDTISQELSKTNKKLFLVFDRDGTLVPFTEDPVDAILDKRVRSSLNRLSEKEGVHVGILSARSLSEIKTDLPERQQILAGNYGLEIECPDGSSFCAPKAQEARQYFEKALGLIKQKLSEKYMCILEDHGLSLCIHYHRTPAELKEEFHQIVSCIAKLIPELEFKELATSYEVWPSIDWNKSNGLAKMLQLAKLKREDVLLLYAGDSLVDEPAFAWVNQEASGISILIGKRLSEARFSLDTPAELHQLIHRLEANYPANAQRDSKQDISTLGHLRASTD